MSLQPLLQLFSVENTFERSARTIILDFDTSKLPHTRTIQISSERKCRTIFVSDYTKNSSRDNTTKPPNSNSVPSPPLFIPDTQNKPPKMGLRHPNSIYGSQIRYPSRPLLFFRPPPTRTSFQKHHVRGRGVQESIRTKSTSPPKMDSRSVNRHSWRRGGPNVRFAF